MGESKSEQREKMYVSWRSTTYLFIEGRSFTPSQKYVNRACTEWDINTLLTEGMLELPRTYPMDFRSSECISWNQQLLKNELGTTFRNHGFHILVAVALHPGHAHFAIAKCEALTAQQRAEEEQGWVRITAGAMEVQWTEFHKQCFVLHTHFCLPLAGQWAVPPFPVQPHGEGFAACSVLQPLAMSLLLSWAFMQEIAELILEAKTAKRGQ